MQPAQPEDLDDIREQAKAALTELISLAHIGPGSVVIVGGSTSEVQGERIGTRAQLSIGEAITAGLLEAAQAGAVELAVQCCEHLNR
ncbi:hypothetical protein B1A_14967, partial [mine drainage metagenome]